MRNRRRDYTKSYRLSFFAVVVLLTVYQFVPPEIVPLQFLTLALVVYFAAVGLVDLANDQREIATRQKEIETNLANKTPTTEYMKSATRAFDAISTVIDRFIAMDDDERDDFLFLFPSLIDLREILERNRPYTVKQAQLVLFHRLERKHSFWYLPTVRKEKTATRVWLSALENDLIEIGCARRENATSRAYLTETPETCFDRLFFSPADLFEIDKN